VFGYPFEQHRLTLQAHYSTRLASSHFFSFFFFFFFSSFFFVCLFLQLVFGASAMQMCMTHRRPIDSGHMHAAHVYILDDHISMSISQNKMWTRSEDEQSNNDKKKKDQVA
jgi:hypothetical protein